MDQMRRSSLGGTRRSSFGVAPKSPPCDVAGVCSCKWSSGMVSRTGPIPIGSEKECVPLVALNPYQSQWTIKVKVAKLYELRRITSKRDPHDEYSVFTALLIDDQATQIEGTFWRESAEYYHEKLVEGKVYYFSNFTVKTANKRFSSVDFDYSLSIDSRTMVEEAMDQDTSQMQAKVETTEFSDLSKFIDQPTLVSVFGVVTEVAATGKVKRRADSSELLRRDVTLIDKSLKTVSLTLWGNLAETVGNELEQLAGSETVVVLIKKVRITSFNGISLATINRTEVEVNPDLPEARDLRDWYDLVGKTETTTALSEGMPNVRASAGMDEPKFLKDVDLTEVPSVDADPVYSTIHGVVVFISNDQKMYYLANTSNNKKVVEQDGQYFCEFDGKLYDSAVLRYIISMKISDFTKECWVNVFNDEAEKLIGVSAPELDEMRQEAPERFNMQLTRSKFKPVVMRIMSKARELPTSGDVVLRHNVVAVKPLNFKEETQRLLRGIEAYTSQE